MKFRTGKNVSALLASALLLASAAQAQQPSALQQEQNGAIRIDVSLVLVEASVKDRYGKVMDGLTPEDFVIREDGVPQTISNFSRDQLPLAVAMVRPISYASSTVMEATLPPFAMSRPITSVKSSVDIFT